MKPRNKLDRKILALAEKLPPITDKQRQYAFDHCFKPRAVYKPRKREVRCLCCGRVAVWPKPFLESFIDVEQYDCPYCYKTTSIERYYPDTKYREYSFFTILTTFRGIQVARTFEAHRGNYGSDEPTQYHIDEVYQNWLLEDGKEVITGRRLHRSAFYLTWDVHLPLEIHTHNGGGGGAYQYDDVYDISGNVFYPDVRVTPLIRRNGWTRELMKYQGGISMVDAMRYLLTVPAAEMAVKTRQLDIFYNMVRRGVDNIPVYALRIANRHKYTVPDTQMWLDTISMAADLGLDTHNPAVVCPPDLRAFHDSLLPRIRRLHERREKEKQLKDAKDYENVYTKKKGRFLGLSFADDEINIHVISSVAEMAKEGEAMHHCVFSAGYYKRDDCLILSATDKGGNRLETIEVSLKSFAVLQSRAMFNKTSEYHDKILDLVARNMWQIRKAASA